MYNLINCYGLLKLVSVKILQRVACIEVNAYVLVQSP